MKKTIAVVAIVAIAGAIAVARAQTARTRAQNAVASGTRGATRYSS